MPQSAGQRTRRPLCTFWDWQQYGRCHGSDTELFFPSDRESRDERRARVQQAKLFCQSCVVRDECLSYALEAREAFGVWGGLTAHEREALLARHDDQSA